MMELYTGRDEAAFPELFQKMYKQRFDIYVKRRKWKGLKPSGELEKDDYDTESAVYLLVMDDEDEILAGLRLLPTVGPHILGDLFPHLAGAGVPSAPGVLELTRFYVAPFKVSKPVRDWLVGVLCAGMIEYCLASCASPASSTPSCSNSCCRWNGRCGPWDCRSATPRGRPWLSAST
jgi:acyl-homoserine lactone synthase